jgi:hypothetical protein
MGVAIGNVVDIVSTYIVVLPLVVYFMISSGVDPASAREGLMTSITFRISSSILGALCSVLGGYVSARVAKHDEVLNGALSSILCLGFGVYDLIGGSVADHHLGFELLFLSLMSPVLGAIGGYLSSQRSAKQRRQAAVG